MNPCLLISAIGVLLAGPCMASTVTVVPVFEPISLHDTDGDDAIADIGETLQASVVSRPMALTGAFPEAIIEAIRTPHLLPTNHPNFKPTETNLLVLCNIGISAEQTPAGISVKINASQLKVPANVDLTPRQILKLTILAVRKSLEAHQSPQSKPLEAAIYIHEDADEDEDPNTKPLFQDLNCKVTIPPKSPTP